MAWRDRLRRRSAGTGGVRRGEREGAPAAAVPGAPAAAAPDAPAAAVPADWDGGWRRTAPPELTVSRAPLGVSDGLAFRSGLAAWQNPSFDSGLAHALLPTAPTGLVHGVTHRPAGPRAARAEGGPLLLRALRQDGDRETPDGPAPADAASSGPASSGSASTGSAAPVVGPKASRASRGGAAGKGRTGDGSPGRGLTSAGSPAVLSSSSPAVQRSVEPGAGPVVAPAGPGRRPATPEIPVVRRVTAVPSAAAPGGSAAQARSGSGGGARAQASRAPGSDVSDVPRPAVRPRPTSPSLTVARRPAGPVRRVPALRPPAPAPAPAPDKGAQAPARPAADKAPEAPGGHSATTAGTAGAATTARPAGPAQGTASRAPLGAPLTELPSTARPLTDNSPVRRAPAGTGPALPVVQRQTEGASGTPGSYDGGPKDTAQRTPGGPAGTPGRSSARSGARARGGLGAPLPEMPPSADIPGGRGDRRAARAPQDRAPGATPDQGRTPAADPAPHTAHPGGLPPAYGLRQV
ncbi:hypothetical protein ACWCQV_38915, partial [Streptomyces eurythermus]